jgi:hypothetical protein
MEFYSATKKNEILLFTSKWMELEKLARVRRQKSTWSPSFADYRPKANAVILLDVGYTLRGEC